MSKDTSGGKKKPHPPAGIEILEAEEILGGNPAEDTEDEPTPPSHPHGTSGLSRGTLPETRSPFGRRSLENARTEVPTEGKNDAVLEAEEDAKMPSPAASPKAALRQTVPIQRSAIEPPRLVAAPDPPDEPEEKGFHFGLRHIVIITLLVLSCGCCCGIFVSV